MKTVISVEIGDDDNLERIQRIAHVDDAFAFIHEYQQYLRTQYKYVEPENRDDISAMRTVFSDMLFENGLVLDALYS